MVKRWDEGPSPHRLEETIGIHLKACAGGFQEPKVKLDIGRHWNREEWEIWKTLE